MGNETIGKTLAVAVGVCVVCSVFVSTASVYLKPMQEQNKKLDKQKNVLVAAGLLQEGEKLDAEEVAKRFAGIDTQWIELETGQPVSQDDVPEECLDERKAAKKPQYSQVIQNDIAKISRTPKYRQVYFTGDGERVILPVHGKGLWSTMYGFLALDRQDLNTIKSFAFYEHGETPGLGGEVDAASWKKSWRDKKAFDDAGEPKITVIKGKADPGSAHDIDGLSGATLTAKGVQKLVRFWLDKEGYGPFLTKLREGSADG
jgi:Na+-transporting NADH:ubiquinone oxidoreductase subunit C